MLEKDQTILKKYRIIQTNDECPFYETAVVEHIRLHRYEVLYLINPDVFAKGEIYTSLKNEFGKFAGATADFLPEFLDYGFYNGVPYFTRKYMQGTPVSEIYLNQENFDKDDFLNFFQSLISHLTYLHNNYITWTKLNLSDLKLFNGQIVFVHFHFSKCLIHIKSSLTEEQSAWVENTSGLHYGLDSINFEKNLFSLGELFYETLYKKSIKHSLNTYHKNSGERKHLKKKKRDLLPPLRLNAEIPINYESFILKCAHKPGSGGYANLKEMSADFDNIVQGKSIEPFSFGEASEKAEEKKQEKSIKSAKGSSMDVSISDFFIKKPQKISEKVHTFKKKRNYKLYFEIIIPALIVAVLGYAAYIIIPPLIKINHQPIASAAASTNICETGNEIFLEGTKSSDPDGDQLFFFWEVIEPKDAQVIIAENNTHLAGKTKIIFLTNGEYKIALKVFDGKLYSEPAEIKIKVK